MHATGANPLHQRGSASDQDERLELDHTLVGLRRSLAGVVSLKFVEKVDRSKNGLRG
jgi:hypothetical protein